MEIKLHFQEKGESEYFIASQNFEVFNRVVDNWLSGGAK